VDTIDEFLGPVSQRVDAGCNVDGGQDTGSPTSNLAVEVTDHEVSCSFTGGLVSKRRLYQYDPTTMTTLSSPARAHWITGLFLFCPLLSMPVASSRRN